MNNTALTLYQPKPFPGLGYAMAIAGAVALVPAASALVDYLEKATRTDTYLNSLKLVHSDINWNECVRRGDWGCRNYDERNPIVLIDKLTPVTDYFPLAVVASTMNVYINLAHNGSIPEYDPNNAQTRSVIVAAISKTGTLNKISVEKVLTQFFWRTYSREIPTDGFIRPFSYSRQDQRPAETLPGGSLTPDKEEEPGFLATIANILSGVKGVIIWGGLAAIAVFLLFKWRESSPKMLNK